MTDSHDDEIMCSAKRIRIETSFCEVRIIFTCPTEEEAQLSFSAIERQLQNPEANKFTIRLGARS
jgi:hypothetical protein